MLQHCFPPNLRQFLKQLPETLDETYERILKGINKAQKDDARRLLHCLAAAVRPLHVEELAELLAYDFRATGEQGIPKLKEDWRWDDQEQAVLSTCSSLIAIVRSGDSRVVQFSHFSVKEYLTSPRLAQSHGDVSQYHIDLDAAHTLLAQACLGTLLRLDEDSGKDGAKGFPLAKYAAEHWVDHATFETVSSRVRDGMDDLFNASKPHFAAWLRVHDIDRNWPKFASGLKYGVGSPLYYAAFCGLYGLAERLITKHPEQVNAGGGRILAPLPAALYNRHFRVADLLHRHGAVVDVLGNYGWTVLHAATDERGDIIRWLLKHGAETNARDDNSWTPLHLAAHRICLEAIQALLEYDADINSRSNERNTPLYLAVCHLQADPGEAADVVAVNVVRRLLEHGADPNILHRSHSTPLHIASSQGAVEVVRLLLSYGANVDEKDGEGRTSFQVASSKGRHEIVKLLLERGAVPQP